jgi:hypothetical protein
MEGIWGKPEEDEQEQKDFQLLINSWFGKYRNLREVIFVYIL